LATDPRFKNKIAFDLHMKEIPAVGQHPGILKKSAFGLERTISLPPSARDAEGSFIHCIFARRSVCCEEVSASSGGDRCCLKRKNIPT